MNQSVLLKTATANSLLYPLYYKADNLTADHEMIDNESLNLLNESNALTISMNFKNKFFNKSEKKNSSNDHSNSNTEFQQYSNGSVAFAKQTTTVVQRKIIKTTTRSSSSGIHSETVTSSDFSQGGGAMFALGSGSTSSPPLSPSFAHFGLPHLTSGFEKLKHPPSSSLAPFHGTSYSPVMIDSSKDPNMGNKFQDMVMTFGKLSNKGNVDDSLGSKTTVTSTYTKQPRFGQFNNREDYGVFNSSSNNTTSAVDNPSYYTHQLSSGSFNNKKLNEGSGAYSKSKNPFLGTSRGPGVGANVERKLSWQKSDDDQTSMEAYRVDKKPGSSRPLPAVPLLSRKSSRSSPPPAVPPLIPKSDYGVAASGNDYESSFIYPEQDVYEEEGIYEDLYDKVGAAKTNKKGTIVEQAKAKLLAQSTGNNSQPPRFDRPMKPADPIRYTGHYPQLCVEKK